MKKSRKIVYVPGLISAILIPLVFWYLGNRKLEESVLRAIQIGLPAKIDENKKWTYQMTFEPYRNWNYKTILVKPNSAKHNSRSFINEIHSLQTKNIKNTGIEFILNDENSYGDLVSILNDLIIANQRQYGIDLEKTGHLFIGVNYKNPLIQEIEFIGCGTGLMMEYENNSNNFKGIKKLKNQLKLLPKQTYYLIFGFLIFLTIAVFRIKKYL